MRNRIRSQNSCLPPAFAAALLFFIAPAMAQSLPAGPGSVPVLKGGYVLTAIENCLPVSGGLRNETGTLTFSPNSGTAKITGYLTSGNPLTLNKVKGDATYSNSANTLTLGSTTYQAVYGKLEKGIATYMSFITVESDGCGYQGWLSRQ